MTPETPETFDSHSSICPCIHESSPEISSVWISQATACKHMKIVQPITTQYCILTQLRYTAVENIVRKGEISCNK